RTLGCLKEQLLAAAKAGAQDGALAGVKAAYQQALDAIEKPPHTVEKAVRAIADKLAGVKGAAELASALRKAAEPAASASVAAARTCPLAALTGEAVKALATCVLQAVGAGAKSLVLDTLNDLLQQGLTEIKNRRSIQAIVKKLTTQLSKAELSGAEELA